MPGWRTVVINEKSNLSVKDAQLLAEGKNSVLIPLEQLRQIMVMSSSSTIEAGALASAASNHVHLLFCGEKYVPVCEVIPVGQHHEAAGAVMDQAEWKQERKDDIWKLIVEAKLRNQLSLLRDKQRLPPPQFMDYCACVEPGDKTNREAMAARLYFSSLFGREFRRHAVDTVNSKLNYGYTILCSAFSRVLAMHGFHTGLGIHHCSRDNPVNLSCDLMEPFRPLVDRLVFDSGEAELDWDMKKRFIGMPNLNCRLDGKSITVDEAIETFTLEVLWAVKHCGKELPEVSF